jgi:hypothetical protein
MKKGYEPSTRILITLSRIPFATVLSPTNDLQNNDKGNPTTGSIVPENHSLSLE